MKNYAMLGIWQLEVWLTVLMHTIAFGYAEWPNNCFAKVNNRRVTNVQIVSPVTDKVALENCMTICITKKDACKSFTYQSSRGRCHFYGSGKSGPDMKLVPSRTTDFYERPQRACKRPLEKTNSQKCSAKQLSFIQSEKRQLKSRDGTLVPDITLERCQRLCMNNTDNNGQRFYCSSVEYSEKTRNCLLSRLAAAPFGYDPLEESKDSTSSHFQKICVQSRNPTCKRGYSFEVVSQATLVGFAKEALKAQSVGRCLGMCVDAQKTKQFACHSAMFYYASHECVLNTESRRTKDVDLNPETTGVLVDYFDSRCAAEKQNWLPWESWSDCSQTCGQGFQIRHRMCVKKGTCGSGATSQSKPCTLANCPNTAASENALEPEVHDSLKTIGEWILLSTPENLDCDVDKSCNNSSIKLANDPVSSSRNLAEESFWLGWTDWTGCSSSCGPGRRSRSRECGGEARCTSGARVETRVCDSGVCPKTGELVLSVLQVHWETWTQWSECLATCGASYRSRTRDCSHELTCPLGTTVELALCQVATCETTKRQDEERQWRRSRDHKSISTSKDPTIWGVWAQWSKCSVSCGRGVRARNRLCLFFNRCPSSYSTDVQACSERSCHRNKIRRTQLFAWGNWAPWTICECSRGDSVGIRMRTRTCSQNFRCNGDSFELMDCSCGGGPNPTGGEWGPWQPWSPCGPTNIRTRIRTCIQGGSGGYGQPQTECLGPAMETSSCGDDYGPRPTPTPWVPWSPPTPAPDLAEWSIWQVWTQCSSTCGGGVQTRWRTCNVKNQCVPSIDPKITFTDGFRETHTRLCTNEPCYRPDMSWDQWGPWSSCTRTCGGGERVRRRRCPIFLLCGAGVDTEVATCATEFCPGMWADWIDWSACSATCGTGVQTRTRLCLSDPCIDTGQDMMQTRECMKPPCIGEWGLWQPWTPCSASCGMGSRSRIRRCPMGPGSCGGGEISQMSMCKEVDCMGNWLPWTPWSQCPVTCDRGQRSRNRQCSMGPGRCGFGLDQESSMCELRPCLQDWCPWGPWTCPITCGEGTQTRSRQCGTCGDDNGYSGSSNAGGLGGFGGIDGFGLGGGGGRNCGPGPTTDQSICTRPPCQIDWGPWRPWSCTVTCGQGAQTRSRQCPRPGMCGAGQSQDQSMCTRQPCMQQWCPWGPWSCPVTCGQGTQTRTRQCGTCGDDNGYGAGGSSNRFGGLNGLNGGGNCGPGPTRDQSMCTRPPCQIDWGPWRPWSCTVTCGQGTQTRSRQCPRPGMCGVGQAQDQSLCTRQPCLQEWCPWGPWACTVTCGQGTQTRSRQCGTCDGDNGYGRFGGFNNGGTFDGLNGFNGGSNPGGNCGPGSTRDQSMCTKPPCQMDWGPWRPWSCSVTCGQGVQTRDRQCLQPGMCGLGPAQDQSMCTRQPCLQDWCPWSSWTCTVTCGQGIQTRTRQCGTCGGDNGYDGSNGGISGIGGGQNCGPGETVDQSMCTRQPCQVDWGQWSHWTCAITCGRGTQTRTRTCPQPGMCGFGQAMETDSCMRPPCQLEWEPWGPWCCSVSCGQGTQTRSRTCPQPGMCGFEQNDEQSPCIRDPCQVNWDTWGPWSCSVTCGPGNQMRSRDCPQPGMCGFEPQQEQSQCIREPCRQQDFWLPWGPWSCSVTCGQGVQTRIRQCDSASGIEGNCAGGLGMDQSPCQLQPCEMNWSPWRPWGPCDATCGGGVRERIRDCPFPGQCGFGEETELGQCGEQPCSVDWNQWGQWSTCPVTCGGGMRNRHRTCPVYGLCGSASNKEQQKQRCHSMPCRVSWSHWSQWSACSASCDDGMRFRSRTCPSPGQCPGEPDEQDFCSIEPCQMDWSEWGGWACTVTCGTGTELRRRDCPAPDMCLGDAPQETRMCDLAPCVKSGWGEWGAWSRCSTTCGPGSIQRTRPCITKYLACIGSYLDVQECDNPACSGYGPSWGEWQQWEQCSAPCEGGTRNRLRECSQPGGGCGPGSKQTEKCNTFECGANEGDWGQWDQWSSCTMTCGSGRQWRKRSCSVFNSCDGGFNSQSESQACNTESCLSMRRRLRLRTTS